MQRDQAEVVALQALGWLAGNDELWPVFLGATGAAPADLKASAADPDFLAAVLDFVLQSDTAVTGFCEAAGIGYEVPMQARAALPGGAAMHWT